MERALSEKKLAIADAAVEQAVALRVTEPYALRTRATALGWPDDRVVVIDSDQGESGASAAWREGFRRLVTDVGLGRAGIVMGLEVSRLARNNADVLKARLRGGILNKVRRDEYRCVLPTGPVYDATGAVVFEPDMQVRETIAHFFETFARVGSAHQTVKAFRNEGSTGPPANMRHNPMRNECGRRPVRPVRPVCPVPPPRRPGESRKR
jgi:DNA invertase Pin-like site-specific DNA recombinase